ncbi:S9 family peptidase [Pontibacter sp. G13]|uniref:S9 family peptidase n=1 Tax=Pontibacter sp. G13 TaxID=3074898 RepID=UPI00288C4AB1|nr:S9 family peptidase [Pontibacter sp. G13]WNJ19855.1 S9 family peptidase [Pontibacter sp. G13]
MKHLALWLVVGLFALNPLPAQLSTQSRSNAETITLEKIWMYGQYYPKGVGGFTWMADDRFYSVLEPEVGIASYSVEKAKKVDQILDFSKLDLGGLQPEQVESYRFSADEQKVLLMAEVTSIYRHSSEEFCFVADRQTGKVTPIHAGKKITNATFSPDGSQVGFVFENNVYFTDLASGKEVQVTFDGAHNQIINGLTDWVYEEEFAFVDAFKWSPDGNRIAYYRFDESAVEQFSMSIYGSLYPAMETFKYPKAGEENSKVSIHIYDVDTKKTVQADLGKETDQYIPRIKWTASNDKLAVMRMNRLQNHLEVLLVEAETGASFEFLVEDSETYINEVSDDKWHFMETLGGFLWMSEMDGYNHIYRYDSEGNFMTQITKGDFEVTSLLGVDEENELVYYTSKEESPLENHLYVVNLKGKKKKRLTEEAGSHRITASSDFTYFVDRYSTNTSVPVTVLKNAKGKTIKTLEDNTDLQTRVAKLDISEPEFITAPAADGTELNGYMIKPSDFDPNKQYPVLMFVYGGPGSQQVNNSWGHGNSFNYMWFQMLAQQGYIVACVDNRGTGGRGRDFRASTYADLGNLETLDQVSAAQHFGTLPYVDRNRIGIWGWSYGGYMTSLCMTKGNGTFKAGIAVAPVTNWRFYDTIYTERYLKTPQLNERGYDGNSPINFAKDLKGSYLLVHGTADDNVHVQNSLEMTTALVNANKQFDMFMYPNRNHGIYGGYTRLHLYKKMTDFLLENL